MPSGAKVFKRFALAAAISSGHAGWAAAQALPPPPDSKQSPWNGDWVLSQRRNSAEIKAAAARDYRFHLSRDGRILWEIPSLHELVRGHTNGAPMPIRRPGASGLTLSVRADGPQTLTYAVSRAGKLEGEGRMTLVEQDKAWIDISGPVGRPDLASVVIYVRPANGE